MDQIEAELASNEGGSEKGKATPEARKPRASRSFVGDWSIPQIPERLINRRLASPSPAGVAGFREGPEPDGRAARAGAPGFVDQQQPGESPILGRGVWCGWPRRRMGGGGGEVETSLAAARFPPRIFAGWTGWAGWVASRRSSAWWLGSAPRCLRLLCPGGVYKTCAQDTIQPHRVDLYICSGYNTDTSGRRGCEVIVSTSCGRGRRHLFLRRLMYPRPAGVCSRHFGNGVVGK